MSIFPPKFDEVKLVGIPDEPNLDFTFVVDCPKKYTWDAWHLPKTAGGDNVPITEGNRTASYWPGATENMERVAGPVQEIIGKIETPEDGPWVTSQSQPARRMPAHSCL